MRDERFIELDNALKTIKWDIIGLSEVRRLGEETVETDNSVFFHFGATIGLHGVGFLVAKKLRGNIIEFIGYSERIAVLKLKISNNHTLTLIQVYAPTSSHTDDDVEEFYDLLNKAYDDHRGTFNIVLGDFNAKVGPRQNLDNRDVLGPHGLGTRNERGTRLLQFAFGQNLKVSNSFFHKKPQRRWTWISPDNITKNEIDYVLTSNQSVIKDVAVINRVSFSSDHRPLRLKFSVNIKQHRKTLFKKGIKRLDKQILHHNSEKFNLELKNQFNILQSNDTDPNLQYHNLKTAIDIASKTINQQKKNKANLSEKTLQLIKERETFQKCSRAYYKIDRNVKRSIRNDVRKLNSLLVKSAIENHTSLRIAKEGVIRVKSWINCLADEQGVKQRNKDKIMDISTKFYQNLYSDDSKPKSTTPYNSPDLNTIPPITGFEIHSVLKTMKNNKSPGEDGITTEALKTGGMTLLPHITNLCNTILYEGKLPENLCHANIILLHKKGDKSNISNYRPISLISHIYKILIKVIQNRISDQLDSQQPPEQAGFRPGFSTTDHLQTINQVIEKCNEFNLPLHLAFVDYSKAFDSLSHSSIFDSLNNQSIDPAYINLIKLIYNNSTANIKLNSSGPSFIVEKGVKQGDPLSPKLFTSTLEEVFKTLSTSWENKGIEVGGRRLTNLRFADDIVLFAPTAPELEAMLRELNDASLKVGLSMNRSKTQAMTNRRKQVIEVDGQVIQYVDEYIYLGQLVSFENRQGKEIDRRIDNAWKCYWSMKDLMKGTLPLSLKRKLVDMCILPVLTYGSQTWSLTEQQKTKLKVCQRAMERSILGVKRTDCVRNTTLRSKTRIADVGVQTAKLKWSWAGHVSRMGPDRWAKLATEWVPRAGTRKRGRPKRRWRDDIDRYLPGWWEAAPDRKAWSKLGETFAQQWDT